MADAFGWRARSAKEAVSSSPSPTSTNAQPRIPYVLLVEDNESASGALRVLFEATGHRVAVAATVAEAVSMIAETHPDLVLLDLTLPDGDGFDVVEKVGATVGHRPIFVALTGHDEPEVAARCTAAGMSGLLVKPVPPRELIAKTRQWLDISMKESESQQ